ncbi:hypothetical protein [Oricola sp.]|uniref:hypothetical protein n=1 Tax=Oricola sp. TaxID=1979950 RepID=UPI003BAB8CBE
MYRGFPQNSFNCGTANPVGQLGASPMLQCGAARLSVLTVNRGTSSNAKSLVLNIGYGGNSVTIAGDAQGVTQNAAVANCQAQTAHTTILSASHHGARSYQSNNLAWAQATRPRYVVFQAGQHAGHAHPRVDAWVTYLQDHHTHPRITPPNGDGSQDIILFGYSDTNAPGGTGIRPTNRYLLNTRTVGSIRFRWTRNNVDPDVACRFDGDAFNACVAGIQPNGEMIRPQLPGAAQLAGPDDPDDAGADDPG